MGIKRRGLMVGGAMAAAALGGAAACSASRGGRAADMIFVGGPVVTVGPGAPEVEALAVTGGRITLVGTRSGVMELRGPRTKVVDLAGRALLPAFVEPHSHPSQIAAALAPPAVDVRPFVVQTGAEVLRKLTDAVHRAPAGTPVLLYGIDILLQTDLQLPTMQQLDALAPHNPVVLVANSGHAAYANSAAFALAGITARTPDPTGARYVHGPDGQLTGEVLEVAAIMRLVAPFAENAESAMPGNMRWAYGQLAGAGIATASEHGYQDSQRGLYTAMAADPDCELRIRAYEIGTPQLAADRGHLAPHAWPGGDTLFAQIGMKMWADGSPWQGNIDTTFPYLTDETTARMGLGPHHHGGMNYTPEQVRQLATAFVGQGWQLACHVHGDAAIDVVLDAYEQALTGMPSDLRVRLEHCGAMRPDQFTRARRAGATVSLFMEHVYYWGDVLIDELFGAEHGAHWMSARAALDAGLRISFHNDGTVTPPDPIGNIATAVTRVAKGSGRVLAPEQRIGIDEAIRAQTIDAAWQLHLDSDIGSLEPGKCADLVVLSGNPRTTAPERLRELTVQATYLMGRQTHGDTLA
ncbi:amidohydrolase family protein [Nocardia sp. NEAU-G5]|uniref:Amidohydrolase family protein n=1 Tax=Nocardia albiluteola TaxID=2842303 RepID=A0ABS6B2C2_9NOCA|nr:amidohydrolase [Nocardia albiluteola]MBU3064389.1 amidohydrolase family protein [Nocardia albiluteola]